MTNTNFIDLVIFSLLTGISTSIIHIFVCSLKLLMFNIYIYNDDIYNNALSKLILRHGWCSGKHIQPRIEVPCDGWHFLWKYCVLIHKSSNEESYGRHTTTSNVFKVISFKWNECYLNKEINILCKGIKDCKKNISHTYIELIPFPWRPTKRVQYQKSFDIKKCTSEQYSIANTIALEYYNTSKVSMLVAGPPNTGKSTLADIIATLLKKYNIEASIVHGMNPDRALNLTFIKKKPTHENPIIYIVNEIETAINNALNEKKEKREEKTYSDNKGQFCDYMDQLETRINEIWIFTTNEESLVSDLNNNIINERNVFFRKGRINYLYEMKEKIKN